MLRQAQHDMMGIFINKERPCHPEPVEGRRAVAK